MPRLLAPAPRRPAAGGNAAAAARDVAGRGRRTLAVTAALGCAGILVDGALHGAAAFAPPDHPALTTSIAATLVLVLIIIAAVAAMTMAAPRKRGDDARKVQIFQSTVLIGSWVLGFGVVGLLAILFWCDGADEASGRTFRSLLGADWLVAAGASAVGAFFGFVFAIPRTLDPASRAALATAAQTGPPGAGSQAMLAANTNLERISDWLTTLLIGATLVQIKDIMRWIGGIGAALSSSKALDNAAVVPVIVTFYAALSFLGVYLITRLYLTFAFEQTLYLLTGSATSLTADDVTGRLAAAARGGTPLQLSQARQSFDSSRFSPAERLDPALNDALARTLLRQMRGDPDVRGRAADRALLQDAFRNLAADGGLKAALKGDLDGGKVGSGDDAFDATLGPMLA